MTLAHKWSRNRNLVHIYVEEQCILRGWIWGDLKWGEMVKNVQRQAKGPTSDVGPLHALPSKHNPSTSIRKGTRPLVDVPHFARSVPTPGFLNIFFRHHPPEQEKSKYWRIRSCWVRLSFGGPQTTVTPLLPPSQGHTENAGSRPWNKKLCLP